MQENQAYKLPVNQCRCGCRQSVRGNYAQGHDAKHVARLVRETLEAWCDQEYPMYATEKVWQRAIHELPTEALQRKYRNRMRNLTMASKDMASIVSAMNDPGWQALLRPLGDIHQVDPIAADWATSPWSVAVTAAAMGMSRHGINRRHS